jgi:hypothetical protein
LWAGDLVAQCGLGRGFVLVVADAAVLDLAHRVPQSDAALAMLLECAFGDDAGSCAPVAEPASNIIENQLNISRSSGLSEAFNRGSNPP